MKEVLGSSVAGLPARPGAGLQRSTPLERRLAQFLETVALAAWNGDRFDGGDFQDTAERLGLIENVGFDPAVHEDHYGIGLEKGDDWFVLSPDVQALLSSKAPKRSPSEASAFALSTDEPNTSPQKDITHDH